MMRILAMVSRPVARRKHARNSVVNVRSSIVLDHVLNGGLIHLSADRVMHHRVERLQTSFYTCSPERFIELRALSVHDSWIVRVTRARDVVVVEQMFLHGADGDTSAFGHY
jgi:hypothetical protein